MQPAPVPMPQTALRPIVATVVMVLLLYSLFSGDWSAGGPHGPVRRADLRQLGGADFSGAPAAEEFPSMHEKIIHELSVSNDKLERENWQMRQHILDLRRAMRREGLEGNSSLLTYPGLEEGLAAANDTRRTLFDKHRPKHGLEVEVPKEHAAVVGGVGVGGVDHPRKPYTHAHRSSEQTATEVLQSTGKGD